MTYGTSLTLNLISHASWVATNFVAMDTDKDILRAKFVIISNLVDPAVQLTLRSSFFIDTMHAAISEAAVRRKLIRRLRAILKDVQEKVFLD